MAPEDVREYRATRPTYDPQTGETNPLLVERGVTHGRFEDNARFGQELRRVFRMRAINGVDVSEAHRAVVYAEALDYIAGKLARILSGQESYADHWRDIAGYATLAANFAERGDTRG